MLYKDVIITVPIQLRTNRTNTGIAPSTLVFTSTATLPNFVTMGTLSTLF